MKILFVGVFDTTKKSTNTSQLLAFKKLGHQVSGYNYREKARIYGLVERDKELSYIIENNNYSLVVFSKCNRVSYDVFKKATQKTKTCLWFMDPLQTYDDEMKRKSALVTYVCCDKENVVNEALKYNPSTFRVCEGYDQDVDKPRECNKLYDVSFIGNIYGPRKNIIDSIEAEVKVIDGAYGTSHSEEVSKTKINLNFCTNSGASDRVYKIMAAEGFLLSNEWFGREQYFEDGKECVIFRDIDDLNAKIKFYLDNPALRKQIAKAGKKAVNKFDRLSWARKIVELCNEIQ
jgi:hypothetical protein